MTEEAPQTTDTLLLMTAETDEEALRVEQALLAETENPLQPGDPEEQPSQEIPLAPPPDPLEGRRAPSIMDRVIGRAESQLGVTEDPFGSNRTPYGQWYGVQGQPWCAMFVSWCFFHEGYPLPITTSKGFAYTPAGAKWFRDRGRWSSQPARGHVVFFDFPNDNVNRISHVGIVTGVHGDGSIETVEGNTDERGSRTGGKVMRRRRKVGIVGYGIPDYPGGEDGGGGGDATPTWSHPHGRFIRRPHNNCETVRAWQDRMRQRGFDLGVDGDYGPKSERACRDIQQQTGLEVDGILGPNTWRRTFEG